MGSLGTFPLQGHEEPGFVPSPRLLNPNHPVKVIIVGAGLSGIITAILLSHKVRNLDYTIFDKADRTGGTWAANNYPGVRCDIPSHCYQTTFAPNPRWSEYYSRGEEIRAYYEDLVEKYGLEPHIQLRHEVVRSTWISDAGEWEVETKNLHDGETTLNRAQFFINAQGRLSEPQMPNIPGLETKFAGTVVHTGAWDPTLDVTGKRIAVIGNGASGQQILPNLAPKAAHIDHYVRSRVWVTPAFLKNAVKASGENPGAYQYTAEEMETFERNPEAYLAYRRKLEANLHSKFHRNIIGSPENEQLRRDCIDTMSRRVKGSKEWLDKLLPDFAPGCKRLTPAPGYLETLLEGNCSYIQDNIESVTERAIVTADGTEREVDVIITATGFANGFIPYFPTVGRGGFDLNKEWQPNGAVGFPETYFGIMAPEMPNYFFILQAQSNGGGGSIPLQCEISATYIAKVIRKMQLEAYVSITPSADAVKDFNDYCEGFFRDKVVSDTCSSWLKSKGDKPRNLVWWPGSGHHRIQTSFEPRWEDFDYEVSSEGKRNRYHYFGNGWTEREQTGSVEQLTSYLKCTNVIDLATLHERWDE